MAGSLDYGRPQRTARRTLSLTAYGKVDYGTSYGGIGPSYGTVSINSSTPTTALKVQGHGVIRSLMVYPSGASSGSATITVYIDGVQVYSATTSGFANGNAPGLFVVGDPIAGYDGTAVQFRVVRGDLEFQNELRVEVTGSATVTSAAVYAALESLA